MKKTLKVSMTFWKSVLLVLVFNAQTLEAQFIDPNNALILNTLREIATKHHFALEQERIQTAKMVQQLRQFYDTYTLLRNDIEFSQSLYRDFKAIENLDLTRSYTLSNFILNGDRVNYWFPNATGDITRSTMDIQALVNNGELLDETYQSFSVSINEEEAPDDSEHRRLNAIAGQEAFSKALFEYSLKSKILSHTYDSLARELNEQILDNENNYTEAERTQLLLETVKLKDQSNKYYQQYLELAQRAHDTELKMHDEKMSFLQAKGNWKALKNQMNSISKVRYGFFDVISAPFQPVNKK